MVNVLILLFEVHAELLATEIECLEDGWVHNFVQNVINHLLWTELAAGNKKKVFPYQDFQLT